MKSLLPIYLVFLLVTPDPHPFAAWSQGVGGLVAQTRKPNKPQPNSSKIFRKGVEAFDAKKYEEAVDIFTQILQKQPENTPSKIQLARSLYQLKRYSDASRLFQQLELNMLDPEPSYDYGQTALKLNDFAISLKAFRKVPSGHALYDLASYYAGYCALKTGDYQTALDLFERAVVLPSKLAKTQKIYQKEAERLLTQKQREEVQGGASAAAEAAAAQNTTLQQPQIPTPPDDDSRQPDRMYHYLKPQRGIAVLGRGTNQVQTLDASKEPKYIMKEAEFRVSTGIDRSLNQGRAPHYLLQAVAAVKNIDGETGILGIMPQAEEDQELALRKISPTRFLTYTDVRGAVEWPIADGNSFGLEIGNYAHAANDPGGRTKSSTVLKLFLAQRSQVVNTLLSAASHARMNKFKVSALDARERAKISINTPTHIQFGIQAELQQFADFEDNADMKNNPSLQGSDGPYWLGRLQAEVGYKREKNFEVFAGSLFETARDMRQFTKNNPFLYPNDNEFFMNFDTSQAGGYLRSEIEMTSWIRMGMLYQTAKRSYKRLQTRTKSDQDRTAAEQIFKENFAHSIQHFSAFINLSLNL